MTTYLESLYDLGWSVMASTVNPTQAFCRIVQNFPIKNNDGSVSFKPKTLGVGCVLRLPVEIAREFGYTGKKKCDCFIVANSQVVTKEVLMKVSTVSDPGSQIIAEFLGDGRDKPQSLRIVDITGSVSEDVWESNSCIYIAITNPPKSYWFWRTSLERRRPLAMEHFTSRRRRSFASELYAGGVTCHVLCEGLSSGGGFGFKPYSLVQIPESQDMSPGDNRYVLKMRESSVFATKNDFPEGETALGAVILNIENQFAGVMSFQDQRLFPLILGTPLEEGTVTTSVYFDLGEFF